MTAEEQIEVIRWASKKAGKTKASARKFLRDAGIPVIGLIKDSKKTKKI
jgi:hypothetical protein